MTVGGTHSVTLRAHVTLMRNRGRDERHEAGEVEEGEVLFFSSKK